MIYTNKLILILSVILMVCGCSSKSGNHKTTKENIKSGEVLFQNVGCVNCHSLADEKVYGPALNSIYNKELTIISDGKESKIKVDRKFIIRSISQPNIDKSPEFIKRKMPTPVLTDEEVECIADYLISVNLRK